MGKNINKENDTSIAELLASYIEEALSMLEESNKHARKRNRLAKRQYRQSLLNHEQAERQYLIEKSSLQPTFRLAVTEFLMCEPDFMNDPEQAGEAKYLSGRGVGVDERVLRIKVHVKGDAHYMRPSIVIKQLKKGAADERVSSMSESIYFVQVSNIDMSENLGSSEVYLVYRDKTTLPVIHRYRLTQQLDSALRRWGASHLDTVYAASHKSLSTLNSSAGCAALFVDKKRV